MRNSSEGGALYIVVHGERQNSRETFMLTDSCTLEELNRSQTFSLTTATLTEGSLLARTLPVIAANQLVLLQPAAKAAKVIHGDGHKPTPNCFGASVGKYRGLELTAY